MKTDTALLEKIEDLPEGSEKREAKRLAAGYLDAVSAYEHRGGRAALDAVLKREKDLRIHLVRVRLAHLGLMESGY